MTGITGKWHVPIISDKGGKTDEKAAIMEERGRYSTELQ